MKTKRDVYLMNLEVLNWLLDPFANSATGRSYTMALAYINIAIKYTGRWIQVRDHYPSVFADESLMRLIVDICKKKFKEVTFKFKERSLMVYSK